MKDQTTTGKCKHCGKPFHRWNSIENLCPKCRLIASLNKRTLDEADKSTAKATKFNWKPKKAKKLSEHTNAKNRAWKYVSRFTRLIHCFEDGWGLCYTCGSRHDIYHLEAGHFISRGEAPTRYHPDNLRNQCATCNGYKDGQKHIFRDHLVQEIGIERVEKLEALAKTTGNDSTEYHNLIADMYMKKVADIQKETGKKYW